MKINGRKRGGDLQEWKISCTFVAETKIMAEKENHMEAAGIRTRLVPHGWKEAGIYLLTLNVDGWKPVLGELAGDAERARIEASALGIRVSQEIQRIPQFYPQIKILAKQIMPDHLHVVLQAIEPLPVALGLVVRGLKQGCNRAWREVSAVRAGVGRVGAGEAKAAMQSPSVMTATTDAGREGAGEAQADGAFAAIQSPNALTANADVGREGTGKTQAAIQSPNGMTETTDVGMRSGALFETGYHVRALIERGQLKKMIDYVHDNPRRLAVRREKAAYFRIHRNITAAGRSFDAYGNTELLKGRCLSVVCHGGWNRHEQETYRQERITAAKEGAALVGAFISKQESDIRDEAIEAGGSIILLVENGFPERYKPAGRWFDLCAEGRLLLLAPWAYRKENHTISRNQCLQLNRMAEEIEAERERGR